MIHKSKRLVYLCYHAIHFTVNYLKKMGGYLDHKEAYNIGTLHSRYCVYYLISVEYYKLVISYRELHYHNNHNLLMRTGISNFLS